MVLPELVIVVPAVVVVVVVVVLRRRSSMWMEKFSLPLRSANPRPPFSCYGLFFSFSLQRRRRTILDYSFSRPGRRRLMFCLRPLRLLSRPFVFPRQTVRLAHSSNRFTFPFHPTRDVPGLVLGMMQQNNNGSGRANGDVKRRRKFKDERKEKSSGFDEVLGGY